MDGEAVMHELNKMFAQLESRRGVAFRRPKICCMTAHTAEDVR